MGKKKTNSGTAAGGKAKQKNIQAQSQGQDPDSLESSLRKRSRFSTEHLEQLEALYREGLNLEDEILKDEELSVEELQGALDELESMQDVRSAVEYISEAEVAVKARGENTTADIFRPGVSKSAETAVRSGTDPERKKTHADTEKNPKTEKSDTDTEANPEREKPGADTEVNPETGEPDAESETSPEMAGSAAETEKDKRTAENAAEEKKSKETKPEESISAEIISDGIALEKLASEGVTLGELAAAGITAGKFVTDEEAPEDWYSTDYGTGEKDTAKSKLTDRGDTAAVKDKVEEDFSAVKGTAEEDSSVAESAVDGDLSTAEVSGVADSTMAGNAGAGVSSVAESAVDGDLSAAEVSGVADSTTEGNAGAGGSAVVEDAMDGESPDADASGDGSDEHQTLHRKSGLSAKTGMIQIAVFFVALFGISIVGLCMPLRPTESQIEKRTLTEFPEFTWESFLSGDYTDQISTWYADTFPFRETLLSWYSDFKKLFGLQGDEVYIGDVIVADDIPDIPDEDETSTVATDTDATDTDAVSGKNQTEATTETPETTTETPTETTTEAPTETTTEETTEAATEDQTTTSGDSGSSVEGEQIGSVYIYGDQAFSVYGFSLEMSDNYAKMISLAAEELAGKATVYNILVPLSYGIQLDSDLWESMGWSDEEKAIKYMYSQMSDDVKTVSIYQTLLEHKDEYIYFRTDHHWTALGAYYAYQCFASVKGITANALDSYETMTFENYLGSLYSQSNESEALANNPDTITAYVPHGTNKITITQKDGSILDWRVIYDVTSWRKDSKYSCFIGGDNPFSVIENPEITDGSTVLLVKESFGNAFAPFLVDHYQYVYIIDFRYYSGHLEEVVDTYGIQDVIFMNNLNSAGGSLQNYLKTFIEPEETGTQE